MIGCFRADFTYPHYFITRNTNWIFEPTAIPELKQRHIQTDVCWIECFVGSHFLEKSCEMFYVIHLTSHFGLNKLGEASTLFDSNSFSRSEFE